MTFSFCACAPSSTEVGDAIDLDANTTCGAVCLRCRCEWSCHGPCVHVPDLASGVGERTRHVGDDAHAQWLPGLRKKAGGEQRCSRRKRKLRNHAMVHYN